MTAITSRIAMKDCAIRKVSWSRHRNVPSRNDKRARLFPRTRMRMQIRVAGCKKNKRVQERARDTYWNFVSLPPLPSISDTVHAHKLFISLFLSVCLLLSLRVSVALTIVVILSFFHFHDPGTELPFLSLIHTYSLSLSFSPRSHARTKATKSR